jgi:hypothetical protein
VLKTQRLLTRGKAGDDGLIAVPSGALHIHTARALHDRALRIMQALVGAFAARGFAVAGTSDGARVTIAEADAHAPFPPLRTQPSNGGRETRRD